VASAALLALGWLGAAARRVGAGAAVGLDVRAGSLVRHCDVIGVVCGRGVSGLCSRGLRADLRVLRSYIPREMLLRLEMYRDVIAEVVMVATLLAHCPPNETVRFGQFGRNSVWSTRVRIRDMSAL